LSCFRSQGIDMQCLVDGRVGFLLQFPQMVLIGHGPQDGVGLNQLDLRRQELVRIVESGLAASWPTMPVGIFRSTSTVTMDSYIGVRRSETISVAIALIAMKDRIFQRCRRKTQR